MRYFELYLAALYDSLQLGGEQSVVDLRINEVNNPTQTEFANWYKGLPFVTCDTCGAAFTSTDTVPLLHAEIQCPKCEAPPPPATP